MAMWVSGARPSDWTLRSVSGHPGHPTPRVGAADCPPLAPGKAASQDSVPLRFKPPGLSAWERARTASALAFFRTGLRASGCWRLVCESSLRATGLRGHVRGPHHTQRESAPVQQRDGRETAQAPRCALPPGL